MENANKNNNRLSLPPGECIAEMCLFKLLSSASLLICNKHPWLKPSSLQRRRASSRHPASKARPPAASASSPSSPAVGARHPAPVRASPARPASAPTPLQTRCTRPPRPCAATAARVPRLCPGARLVPFIRPLRLRRGLFRISTKTRTVRFEPVPAPRLTPLNLPVR